jgi:hypothetical protein
VQSVAGARGGLPTLQVSCLKRRVDLCQGRNEQDALALDALVVAVCPIWEGALAKVTPSADTLDRLLGRSLRLM